MRFDTLKRCPKVLGMSLLITSIFVACSSADDPVISTAEPDASKIFPVRPTDDLVAAGKLLYSEYCASCHGDVDFPPPVSSAPSHLDDGHTWHHPDRLLFDWIMDGVPLATIMPKWRGQLTEDEVITILAYIKSNWSKENLDRQTQGSAQYEDQVKEFGN